ncbi:MAG: PD-(D/E)XK nuclease family protein [Calothrix sp. FI2-JRJ7]|jgi:CRISPR/Cas system-associated exonuclease Cas4 (RecB family)|nr:PD-(D/E)XK nuclease family protein [Calothrix sp. FI2-JRJ7]
MNIQLSLFPEEPGSSISECQNSNITRNSTSKLPPKKTKKVQPAKKRSKPYIWVTWISSLMGEEKQCKFTAWSHAHYKFPKQLSDFDSRTHDDMVRQRAAQHKSQGFAVYVEDNNSFNINGKTCDIGGRPDIVVIENGQPIIEDCKSGKRKTAHRMQVLIYMLLFPLSPIGKRLCQGHTPAGRLVYPDSIVEISPSEINARFKEFFRQTVAIISSSTPPPQVPSFWECRYCNVLGGYCPAKVDPEADTDNHDLF